MLSRADSDPEDLESLKGAGSTEPGASVRFLRGDILSVDDDPAGGWLLESSDDVEHGGLAGAVGPDHLAGVGVKLDLLEGHDAAKADVHLFNLQKRQDSSGDKKRLQAVMEQVRRQRAMSCIA